MTEAKPLYLYFPVRARGELPRLICAAGALDFTDERVPIDEFGSTYKDLTPFGQLPCLVIDGEYFAQKYAISCYLAKKCGLYDPTPNTEIEQLKRDSLMNFLVDVLETIVKALVDKTFKDKPEPLEALKTDLYPKALPRLEKILEKNGSGYYIGSKMTFIDIQAYDTLEHVVQRAEPGFLDKFPKVKANFQMIGELPGVKKYVTNRPPSSPPIDF